jgi:hypothetical protein
VTLVPHDLDAETHLLGAMMMTARAIADASRIVTAGDFYLMAHGALFSLLVSEWEAGRPVDAFVAARGLDPQTLDDLAGPNGLTVMIARTPSTSSASRYASIIASCATRRRVIAAADRVMKHASENPDASEVLDSAAAAFSGIGGPVTGPPADLWTVDDFCDRPKEARVPWVIPGLFRADWRAVVVGAEGQGKSWATRQVGLCAAQGIHPFAFSDIRPVRTLIVDLENPADSISDHCTVLRNQARLQARARYEPGRAWLWPRQRGIDLRSRADRGTFEAVLAHTQPDLVCLGPLYKAYEGQPRETDEQAAAHVQRILDDLRTRYGFALLMEHHAPHGEHGKRDLRPYGSSLWLRWPELGIKLIAQDEEGSILALKRWRGDRMANAWPDRLERGGPYADWPWVGYWKDGIPQEGAA